MNPNIAISASLHSLRLPCPRATPMVGTSLAPAWASRLQWAVPAVRSVQEGLKVFKKAAANENGSLTTAIQNNDVLAAGFPFFPSFLDTPLGALTTLSLSLCWTRQNMTGRHRRCQELPGCKLQKLKKLPEKYEGRSSLNKYTSKTPLFNLHELHSRSGPYHLCRAVASGGKGVRVKLEIQCTSTTALGRLVTGALLGKLPGMIFDSKSLSWPSKLDVFDVFNAFL